MALDWASDHFVRVYTRDTDEDLLLSWEARAVWYEMLRKADRSGLIETKRSVRGLAALIRVPVEVVEQVLQELIEDGRIRSVPAKGFIIPNYLEAQYTPRSDKARQTESRERRRRDALSDSNHVMADDDRSHYVTHGHAESRAVTHNSTDQTHHIGPSAPPAPVVLPLQLQEKYEGGPRKPGRAKRTRCGIPADWKPRDQERELAASLGLDCDAEAREFLNWWLADGRPKKDWDQTFANRLEAQAKRGGGGWRQPEQFRRIEEL